MSVSIVQGKAGITEAISAANLMQNTPVSPASVWAAMRSRAVQATADMLKFADGSVLRYHEASSAYFAM